MKLSVLFFLASFAVSSAMAEESTKASEETVAEHNPLFRSAMRAAVDGGAALWSAKLVGSGAAIVTLGAIIQKAKILYQQQRSVSQDEK